MSMKIWIISAVALVSAGLAAGACSQQSNDLTPSPMRDGAPGGIKGTVTDADGGPVARMRVGIVSGTAPFPEIGPETDAEGRYQIGGVAPGTFQVAVHDRDGDRVGLESVVVQSGETSTLNFSIAVNPSNGTQPPLPVRPVMRLRYEGQVYNGAEGSYCWPDFRTDDGSVVGLCADKIRWAELRSAIPVEGGSTATIEVEAVEQAHALSAGFYELDSDTQVRFLDLDSGTEVALDVDLPEGIYNVAVFGRWPDGDITYEFRIEVRPEP